MRNRSLIFCFVFGGWIVIGAVATEPFSEDHSVRSFDECAKNKNLQIIFHYFFGWLVRKLETADFTNDFG